MKKFITAEEARSASRAVLEQSAAVHGFMGQLAVFIRQAAVKCRTSFTLNEAVDVIYKSGLVEWDETVLGAPNDGRFKDIVLPDATVDYLVLELRTRGYDVSPVLASSPNSLLISW